MNGKRQKIQPGLALQPRDWGEPSVGGSQGVEPSMAKSTLESPAPTDRMSPSTLNPVEPPWYGPVCPVVWEGRHREVPPYPDSDPAADCAPPGPRRIPEDRAPYCREVERGARPSFAPDFPLARRMRNETVPPTRDRCDGLPGAMAKRDRPHGLPPCWERSSSRSGDPGVDRFDPGIAEFTCVSRHHGEPAGGRRRRKKRVRDMIVKRLSTSALIFHDPGTRPSIRQGPVDDPVLEQLIKKIVEPIG